MIKKYIFMALGFISLAIAYIGFITPGIPFSIFLCSPLIVLQSQTRRWNVGYTTIHGSVSSLQTGHRKECSHKKANTQWYLLCQLH